MFLTSGLVDSLRLLFSQAILGLYNSFDSRYGKWAKTFLIVLGLLVVWVIPIPIAAWVSTDFDFRFFLAVHLGATGYGLLILMPVLAIAGSKRSKVHLVAVLAVSYCFGPFFIGFFTYFELCKAILERFS